MLLQLLAQTLQLAASQDGFAVLVPQGVLLLHHLVLLLLQHPHLLLGVAVHLQLSPPKHNHRLVNIELGYVSASDELKRIKVD